MTVITFATAFAEAFNCPRCGDVRLVEFHDTACLEKLKCARLMEMF